MRTSQDVINWLKNNWNHYRGGPRATAPEYVVDHSRNFNKVALAVSSMRHHMSDEGWQVMLALQNTGYKLYGNGSEVINDTNVPRILGATRPGTLVVQDRREWGLNVNNLANPKEAFESPEFMRMDTGCFKVTICKDSHHHPSYHYGNAKAFGYHAWICYYHPAIVSYLACYVRPQHLIRTYHTVNPKLVPQYSPNRMGCLLSGYVHPCYPLREKLLQHLDTLPDVHYMKHPGYHNHGTNTPDYLQTLSRYKVAICTTSVYGYALRKIIEATACGCRVITDLPTDDVLPHIDGNLIRLESNKPEEQVSEIRDRLPYLYDSYNPEVQQSWAIKALLAYNYLSMGAKLAEDIEETRRAYNQSGN